MVCPDSSSRRRVLCITLLFVVSSVMVPPSEPLLLRSSLRLQHHEPADNSPVAIATRGTPSGAILPDLLEKHSPGQASLLQGPDSGEDKDEENEFNLNVGRALDYLAQDVPQMFSAPPRLEIFTQGVVLKVSILRLLEYMLSCTRGLSSTTRQCRYRHAMMKPFARLLRCEF